MVLADCSEAPDTEQCQPSELSNFDWGSYGSDPGHSKYAPLDQINADTVQNLDFAWTWESVDNQAVAERPEFVPTGFKATPITRDGVLYVSTPLGHVAALDAATGEEKWIFNTFTWEHGRPANNGFNHRGVAYWEKTTPGGTEPRIILSTANAFLWSLDAETGQPDRTFGTNGKVDLTIGLGKEVDRAMIAHSAAVPIVGDTVILGSVVYDDPMFDRVPARLTDIPPGHVRGFDLNTGRQKWIFHTIPQQGEFGNDTWQNNSWQVTGATNVWTNLSADPELGYVYLPIGTPGNDWYGGQRLGDNLFGTSLVALDADTGERVWHYQIVHHELWDYDPPAAPTLVDITVDGREIKALAQVSKQAFIYVLDRTTGEPVWPIEERPVPASSVPGERASPTQPFPTRPAPFDQQGISEDTLIDFTPQLRAEALQIISEFDYGMLYTPPSLKGTINLPGWAGGAEWSGAAFDPDTSMYYIPSVSSPIVAQLIEQDLAETEFRYVRNGIRNVNGPQGLPITKPPYGRISAVDLDTGEYHWVRANAEGIRQQIIDMGIDDPGPVGVVNVAPLLVTKSLLFQAITDGVPVLRAMDKASGETVAEFELPAIPQGAPMSYMVDGKQYISIASGGGADAMLVTLALP
ncbi:MAG: pyrroloquinoline quinone-dependent dehydrogenase [Gammaproteobacteria bacterium]|jgi:quinoprotein glucose dehydrogenase|nr:pyrroloquinoline quinone-dependent dehydrogenase [Gammaproteobacteria bacterium]|tara:strand:- start:3662 stop:5566 length:1905 start_codon:yes stop_codon:yes gene_type:complete